MALIDVIDTLSRHKIVALARAIQEREPGAVRPDEMMPMGYSTGIDRPLFELAAMALMFYDK